MRSAAGMSFSNRLSDWLSHAFAVDTPEQQLTQEDVALLDRVAAMIVKRGLISPAVMFLETAKPLNFIGSQVLVFLNPIVTIVFSKWEMTHLSEVLEKRSSVDVLIAAIERADAERAHPSTDS